MIVTVESADVSVVELGIYSAIRIGRPHGVFASLPYPPDSIIREPSSILFLPA